MLTVQPLSLYRLQDYIVTADILFKSILEDNALPIMGLPYCLLSMYYTSEEKKMTDFWNEVKENHLTSIYRGLSEGLNIPTHAEVSATTRSTPIVWDPVETFVQSPNQSVESYTEQKFALKIATDSVSKYQLQFGPGATTYTKSPIIHGAPGSGKSYIAELTCLYIMSQGLKLMSTALMAVRAMAIGGIHLHKFLGLHNK